MSSSVVMGYTSGNSNTDLVLENQSVLVWFILVRGPSSLGVEISFRATKSIKDKTDTKSDAIGNTSIRVGDMCPYMKSHSVRLAAGGPPWASKL